MSQTYLALPQKEQDVAYLINQQRAAQQSDCTNSEKFTRCFKWA
jgi:hypothetical protein